MSLLHPQSIAVIGASAEEGKVGHMVLKNLITQGFKGSLFPVNPKQEEILNLKAYPSVSAIPGTVDLAAIVTPAKTVTALTEECGKKGVKTLVIISAGFGETGTPEGKVMEEEIIKIAKQYKMDVVGPNCLGVLRPSIGMNASFGENLTSTGHVALLSQSGAMAVALMDASASLNLSFSLIVSMGNKTVMDECDFLELCADDPETKTVGLYLESIRDGRRFLEISRKVCRTKPVVLIKSGTSERGKHAVSSHTGALAGSESAIEALCAQTGIRHARTTEQFLDLLRTLDAQPPLLSDNIAVITNAGGPGILATDGAEREDLTLAPLTEANADSLKKKLPTAASVANPIDVLGDALADRYEAALTTALSDPSIDGVAVLLTPQVMTPAEDIAGMIAKISRSHPLIPIVTAFMGGKNVKEAAVILQENGIPNFETPERAIAALASLRPPEALSEKSATTEGCQVSSLAQTFLKDKKGLLAEEDVRELFSLYRLPLPSSTIAKTEREAVTIAQKLGYPLVAKVSSPQILHKTDIGGVRVGLKNDDEVKTAFREIMANAKKHAPEETIDGILLQEFLPAGHEFIVGVIRDPGFGPMIMAGLGGVYTELFRDSVFRIAPVTTEEAYEMLQTLTSWKLLLGMRGQSLSDISALAELISDVSHLATDCPQIVELDLNPVIVRPDGVKIADAKVVIG